MNQVKTILLIDDSPHGRGDHAKALSGYFTRKNIPHRIVQAEDPFDAVEVVGKIADSGGGGLI